MTGDELTLLSKGDPLSIAEFRMNEADKEWAEKDAAAIEAQEKCQKAKREFYRLKHSL